MAAMAADGDGPSESGTVAKRLGKAMSSLGPARANLIAKGLVWAPKHGQIAFSVPGMSAFIDRELAASEARCAGIELIKKVLDGRSPVRTVPHGRSASWPPARVA